MKTPKAYFAGIRVNFLVSFSIFAMISTIDFRINRIRSG